MPLRLARSAATLRLAAAIAAALLLPACRPAIRPVTRPAPARLAATTALIPAPPAEAGFLPSLTATLDSLAEAAIAGHTAPAVAIAVGRHGRLVHLAGYGRVDWPRGSAPVDAATMFDLASLTKVVATTPAAMLLEEAGQLNVDSTVAFYLPEFAASDSAKRAITVRMLLTHQGGLEPYAELFTRYHGRSEYLQQIAARPLKWAPGTHMAYSDWDMIILQLVIERITGEPLDRFAAERIFRPLGMSDTRFLPDPSLRPRIATTAIDSSRGGLLWGVVHDGNAWAMGGVSGHAGLFSSARDLAVYAQMLLNGGRYGDTQLFTPQTVARWTAPQYPGSSRALGWDTPSPPSSFGEYASPWSFGHTGFTGTSIWIDPARDLFVVILTDRVNSAGTTTGHIALRRAVADAVQRAVRDAPLVRWESAH